MKENQRITVTKRMLKEGLLRLLKDEELKKIRITELCQESGVNRATFYRHYETVEDVLLDLERDIAIQMFPVSGFPTELSQVRAKMEWVCTFVKDHADIMEILFRCNAEKDMMRRVCEFYRNYVELQIRERQELRMEPDTVRSVSAFLAGGFYCLLRQWVADGMEQSPAQIADTAFRFIRWPVSEDVFNYGPLYSR